MKYLKITLMAFALCITFFSCQKEEDDTTGIKLEMNNRDKIRLLIVDKAHNNWESSWVELEYKGSFYLTGEYADYDIACIGKVKGLSDINEIPTTGWGKNCTATMGCGYVIRSRNPIGYEDEDDHFLHWCKYARVYVAEEIEDSNEQVVGVIIRYEDNWK